MRDKIDEWLEKAYAEPVFPPDGLEEKIKKEMGALPTRRRNRGKRLEIAAAVLLLCGGMGGVWIASEKMMNHSGDVRMDLAVTRPTEKPQTIQGQNGTDGDTGEDGSETDREEWNRGTETAKSPASREVADDLQQLYHKKQERTQNFFGTEQKSPDLEQGQNFHQPETSPPTLPETSPEALPAPASQVLPVETPQASPDTGQDKDYIQLCCLEDVYYSNDKLHADNSTEENDGKKPSDTNASPEATNSPPTVAAPASTQLPAVDSTDQPSMDGSVSISQAESDLSLFSQRIILSEPELTALRERAKDLQRQGQIRMDTKLLLSRLEEYGSSFFQTNLLCIHTVPAKKGEGLSLAGVAVQRGVTGQDTLVIQLKRIGQSIEPETTGYLSCVVAVSRSILQDNTIVRFEEIAG